MNILSAEGTRFAWFGRAVEASPSSNSSSSSLVIAVLPSFVAPNVFTHVGEAKNLTARSQIEMFGAALDDYRRDNVRYLTTAQGLAKVHLDP